MPVEEGNEGKKMYVMSDRELAVFLKKLKASGQLREEVHLLAEDVEETLQQLQQEWKKKGYAEGTEGTKRD